MAGVDPPQTGIERYLVVLNPYSTNGKKGEQYAAELQKAEPEAEVAIVRAESAAKTCHALLGAIQKGATKPQLIIVAGGDGTVHLVVNALMHADTPAAFRKVPLTAWALGGGNDFFHSIHTKEAEREPIRVVQREHAHTVKVYPLELNFTATDGSLQRKFALCYGTIGATGKASLILNDVDNRARRKNLIAPARLVHAMAHGAPAILLPKKFTAVIDGKQQQLIEMQFVNGPLMTIHAHYNIRLSERAMFVSIIPQASPLTSMITTTRMFLGKPQGRRETKSVQFTLEQPVNAQVDGEHLLLPEGSITVGPAKTALTIWATKPA